MGKKRSPLGNNPIGPIDPDSTIREMVRGNQKNRPSPTEPPTKGPGQRTEKTTVTPGGLLRKTVYFTEEEWHAIRTCSYREDINYSDVVRRAVRKEMGLPISGE
jgi:hypothetical protein